MNLSFLDDIVAWASTASWVMQMAVKALTILASLFPKAAEEIKNFVIGFFDLFDKKEAEEGIPATKEEKLAATDEIVMMIQTKYHGSGSLISESWIRAIVALFVDVIKAMRYGENTARNEKAVLKGYMSTSEDVQRAAQTHAGFKLFGV